MESDTGRKQNAFLILQVKENMETLNLGELMPMPKGDVFLVRREQIKGNKYASK